MGRIWPADRWIVGLGGVFVKFGDFPFNRRLESRLTHLCQRHKFDALVKSHNFSYHLL